MIAAIYSLSGSSAQTSKFPEKGCDVCVKHMNWWCYYTLT